MMDAQEIINSSNKTKKSSKKELIVYLLIFLLVLANAYLLYQKSIENTEPNRELINQSIIYGMSIMNSQLGELAKNCRIIPIKYEDIVYNVTSLHCLNKIGG